MAVHTGLVQRASPRLSGRCRVRLSGSQLRCVASPEKTEQLQAVPRKKLERVARLTGSITRSLDIIEGSKPIAEYMALPASQYSVLDANKIERISEDTFYCYVGGLKFLSVTVEPVLTVSVVTQPRGCTISLLACKLQGSPAMEELNDKFEASMTNRVTWAEGSSPGSRVISSSTDIEVALEVPRWCAGLPVEAVGREVMGATLRLMVPRFLQQLHRDYQQWAAGDTSRKPLGNGQL